MDLQKFYYFVKMDWRADGNGFPSDDPHPFRVDNGLSIRGWPEAPPLAVLLSCCMARGQEVIHIISEERLSTDESDFSVVTIVGEALSLMTSLP